MASPHTIEIEMYEGLALPRAEVKSHIHEASLATLQHQGAPPGRVLTIVLSHDDHLRKLNRQYAGHNDATDVLSFPCQECIEEAYLGDIIISVETADGQARVMGHDLKTELRILTIHGTLHLLGHDHSNSETKARMWSAQKEIIVHLET